MRIFSQNFFILTLLSAYIRNGSYNVWVVDWGNLSLPPCYRAAVNNLRAVARCTGELLTSLRVAGLQSDKVTCVGHSLGKETEYCIGSEVD